MMMMMMRRKINRKQSINATAIPGRGKANDIYGSTIVIGPSVNLITGDVS